ncbi:MAG: S1/P1 nuclease [Bacteroidales bacterium]|nr:S1/P1 nuclease [Bacteroidales bacterium]
MALVFSSLQVFAWGQKGHAVIACIAEQHLTKKASKKVHDILNGRSLVYYASWLDEVQNSPWWESSYKRTKVWHYYNIDSGFNIDNMPRNPEGDALSAIEMLTDSLENHFSELNDSVRMDYLRALIHVVADIHCPMHVGHATDIGGNLTKVSWFMSKTTLHAVWDEKLINSVHSSWSYTEWQKNIDFVTKSEMAEMTKTEPREWVEESHKIAAYIYDYANRDTNYSFKYMYDNVKIVENQMIKAGYRLAYLLNRIFG